MFRSSIAFSALILFALSGCKVAITAPENGRVTTASTIHNCNNGEVCVVEVNDFLFNEEFIAVPDEGYEFRWWQTGHGQLCGGASTSCRIVSAALENSESGRAIIASDAEFGLSPVFSLPHGSTPLSNESAASCFNAEMYTPGYSQYLTYVFPAHNDIKSTRYHRTVGEPVEYGGESYTRVVTTLRVMGIAQEISQETLLGVDDSVPLVSFRKATVTKLPDYDGELWYDFEVGAQMVHPQSLQVETYEQTAATRFDLAVDDSYSESGVWNVGYEGLVASPVFPNTYDRQTSYEGVQEITVPAGTFKACRFRSHLKIDSADAVNKHTVRWYAQGSGLLLMETNGDLEPQKMLVDMSSDIEK